MENLNLVNAKYAIEMLRNHGVSNGSALGFHAGWCDIAADQLESAISIIKSYGEQIFSLENRLKECENGYEGTLYLERCKLHDAEEKIKELTEQNNKLRAEVSIKRMFLDVAVGGIKRERIYTVREMVERLKALLKTDYINGTREHALSVIDQIAQEMLEGKYWKQFTDTE